MKAQSASASFATFWMIVLDSAWQIPSYEEFQIPTLFPIDHRQLHQLLQLILFRILDDFRGEPRDHMADAFKLAPSRGCAFVLFALV